LRNILITTETIRGTDRSYSGHKTAEFAHDAHQLTLAAFGTFSVSNNSGIWTVPEGSAAWIPAGTRHSIEPLPRAQTRTLYLSIRRPVRRSFSEGGSREAAKADHIVVLHVTPLMRAIVDHVCDPKADRTAAGSKHLLAVVLDQLPQQRQLPLFLPGLKSPLALRVAKALASDPAGTPRIRDLAAELGVSARTLERAFAADARMSLGEWRQRSRMCRAIALLAAGGSVQDVALEVGYETPSAFVSAFKKSVGTTPGKIATRHAR
jgi:AraC-like DNA-binding protein